MSLVSNSITEILNEIGNELVNQISLANKADKKIDSRKLAQHSAGSTSGCDRSGPAGYTLIGADADPGRIAI